LFVADQKLTCLLQDIIKIEDTPKPAKKTAGRRSGRKWHTVDLPEGCGSEWRKKFIPTFFKWISNLDDSWTVDDVAAKSALQKIWKVSFPEIAYKIKTDGPVFVVVSLVFSDHFMAPIPIK
jgi:hypothetical protein